MNLNLRVAVYRGGAFWQECWNSIKENIDLFDGVYISFNYSECQKEDIALVESFDSAKIKWRKEEKTLSSVEHAWNIDEWLKHQGIKGHILILCHDDILVRDGLLQVKKMTLQQNEAVWLNAQFFAEKGIDLPAVCQTDIVSAEKILSEEFVATLTQRALNVSRVIVPVDVFFEPVSPWKLLKYGYYAEIGFLCNNAVKFIQQCTMVGIKIRMHIESEGANVITSKKVWDGLFIFCYCMLIFDKKEIQLCIAKHTGYILKNNFFISLYSFFSVQKALRKFECYKLSKIMKLWVYMFQIFLKKI